MYKVTIIISKCSIKRVVNQYADGCRQACRDGKMAVIYRLLDKIDYFCLVIQNRM